MGNVTTLIISTSIKARVVRIKFNLEILIVLNRVLPLLTFFIIKLIVVDTLVSRVNLAIIIRGIRYYSVLKVGIPVCSRYPDN